MSTESRNQLQAPPACASHRAEAASHNRAEAASRIFSRTPPATPSPGGDASGTITAVGMLACCCECCDHCGAYCRSCDDYCELGE